MMTINTKDLNTLFYWAKLGVAQGRGDLHHKQYQNTEHPHDKINRIHTKIIRTQTCSWSNRGSVNKHYVLTEIK